MIYTTTTHFRSMDEWNDHPHGWEVDFRATRAGETHSTVQQSAASQLLITTGTFDAPTWQRGTTPAGMRTFALPLTLGRDLLWRGHRVSRGSLLVFPDDRELHCTTSGPVKILTLSVSDALIAADGDGEGLSASPLASGGALALGSIDLAALLRHIATLSEFVTKYGDHRHAPAISHLLEEELLQGLSEQLMLSATQASRIAPDKRYRVIRAALDFIASRARTPLRVSEVAGGIGTSTRTLQLCFRQHLGVTPKHYIRALQLAGVRRDLLGSDSRHHRVTDLAASWGFWHMGQFGRDYRRMFSETPGATLRRPAPHKNLRTLTPTPY